MVDQVTLLPAEIDGRRFGSLVPISEREWLDRIGSGEGCWREVGEKSRPLIRARFREMRGVFLPLPNSLEHT